MKTHTYKYLGLFFAVTFFSATQVFAQETYLLRQLRVPEITQENPGAYIPYDAHIAIPGLGRVNAGTNLPLHMGNLDKISVENTLNKLRNINTIGVWVQDNLLDFGWRVNKNYFTISVKAKTDVGFAFKKDLFRFLIEGNTFPDNDKLNFFGNNALSITAYLEAGLGYNREINDNISFGFNARYLSGIANIGTPKMDLSLRSGEDYHELIMNYSLEGKLASIFEIDVERDAQGNVLRDTSGKAKLKEVSSIGDMLSNLKNHGFAFDIGARYRINKFLEIDLSVLDIGFINWTTYTKQYNIENGEYVLTGYTADGSIIDRLDTMKFMDIYKEYWQEIGDSLAGILASELQSSSSYRKWLNTKFNFGLSFYASDNDRFTATFNGVLLNGAFIPSGSISYRRTCKRWLDVVIGNTFKPNSLLNPGAGVNFTLGVFQLYVLADYTNTLAYIDRAKNVNVVFGINFIAHRKKDEFKASYPY